MTCGPNFRTIEKKISDLMHLYFQSGFFTGFFAFFHLKTKLTNFFSFHFFFFSFVIALVTKTLYAIVVQIVEQLKKISDLMHLYFQSGVLQAFLHFFISKQN
jgi:hypothetical protein